MSKNKKTYIDEISENVDVIEKNIILLKNDSENIDLLEDTLNLIKVINGNASMKNYTILYSISEALISFIEELIDSRRHLKDDIIKLLLLSVKYYRTAIDEVKTGNYSIKIDTLSYALKNIDSNKQIDINSVYQKDILQKEFSLEKLEHTSEIDNRKKVEVSLLKVDNVINKLNDIVLNQYQLKNEIEGLQKTENQLGELTEKIDEVSENRKLNGILKNEIADHISSLKELRSNLANKISQSERDTFSLQEDVLSFRMIPSHIINPELTNIVRNKAKEFNKKVSLSFEGPDPMVDKFILQKLITPLENILINSVEHGIENPKQREEHNKDPEGKITISYTESGGKISIYIKDDGLGIDFKQFRLLCMNVFPYEADDIEQMHDEELIKYLFVQGVTTKSESGFLSKGGNGLYEAHEGIEQVKGKISIKNGEENGLEIIITVPKSLTTVNGFFVRSAGEKFLIPSTFIDEIIYVNTNDIIDLITKHAVKLRNDIIPIYPLSGALKLSHSHSGEKLHVIIVDELGDKIGIIVDEILYHSSVIYKPLPHNVEKIKSLQGVVFDEEYNIVNILHIPEIIKKLKTIRNIEFRDKFSKDNLIYKNILIVDDSEINRRIEKNIISQLNVSIDEAENGIDALSKIRDKHYDLIITDLNMPQMDGITFIENMRKEHEYESTPVIMLASSNEEVENIKYNELSINKVYNKSFFNRDMLVEAAENLISEDNEE